MPTPFFSVITATHLRPVLLARALESLSAQTFQDFETIVVADALDAGTATVCAQQLRAHDVFIKRSGEGGPADSRNLGMSLARGQWLLFLDDDDTFLPQHLQTAHHRITLPANPAEREAQVLFSDYEVVTENREQTPITTLARAPMPLKHQVPMSLHLKNFIPNNALFFHRQLLDGLRVDPHLQSQEDWDFLLGVCNRQLPSYYPGGGAVVHKDFVNPGIRRGTQTTSNDTTVVADFLHIYRRWRAPNPEIQAQRQALIKQVGLDLPVAWY